MAITLVAENMCNVCSMSTQFLAEKCHRFAVMAGKGWIAMMRWWLAYWNPCLFKLRIGCSSSMFYPMSLLPLNAGSEKCIHVIDLFFKEGRLSVKS